MPADQITYARLADLLKGRDTQLVEVLPEEEYRAAHLPGALNIPLKLLDADTTAALDRMRPVVVYCWDSL
jgi:rhodanese-related sulfurtransferase